jgi:AraC-like DNA-binding protein
LVQNIHHASNQKKLALSVGMNSKKLNYAFHRVYGTTINEFREEYKMKKALRLLFTTAKSVDEIAIECAFANSSYFITRFKQMFGDTPRQVQGEVMSKSS